MRLTRVLSPVSPALVMVLAAGLPVPAGAVTFERTWFGPNGNSRGLTVEQTPDRGYVVGVEHSENRKMYVCLLRTDSLGDTVWTRAFGGRTYPDSVQGYVGGEACMMRTGGYAICASAYRQQTALDVIIFGTNSVGDSLWNWQYIGPGMDDFYWLAATFDGGLIGSGRFTGLPQGENLTFVKLDSAGSLEWLKVVNVDPPLGGRKCLQTRDSGFVAIGEVDTGSNYVLHIVKLNAAGDSQWVRSYGGPVPPNAFCQTYDDGFMFVGYYWPFQSATLMRTDENGDSLWTRTLGLNIGLYAVAETEDRGFIMAGYGPDESLKLVRTDSLGEVLWTRGFLPSFGWYATPFDVKQTADRGFVVTGDLDCFYVYLIKTDSLGNVEVGIEESPFAADGRPLHASPNPSRGLTRISYHVLTPGRVLVQVFDVSGRAVAMLADRVVSAGRHETSWNPHGLAGGVYLITVTRPDAVETEKLLLAR